MCLNASGLHEILQYLDRLLHNTWWCHQTLAVGTLPINEDLYLYLELEGDLRIHTIIIVLRDQRESQAIVEGANQSHVEGLH